MLEVGRLLGGRPSLKALTLISVAEPVVLPAIMPGDSFAVPLHLTSWRLQARPKGLGVFFCKAPIHWTNVVKTTEVSSSKRECHSMDTEKSRFFRYAQLCDAYQFCTFLKNSFYSCW